MAERAIDREYLRYQYDDAEKLCGPIDGVRELPADGSHRAPLLARVGARVSEVVARDGVFRVSKTVGCFVATA